MSLATANAAPTDGVRVKVWVDWDRQPVSVHSERSEDLEALILHLRQQHNVRKRSLVMPDREQGGFLFSFTSLATHVGFQHFLTDGE